MKKLWYQFMRKYITLGLFFYFKRIKVHGKENIPKKGAILFVCNHPNALLDPLLIKTTIHKDLYVLTRAGVFKNKLLTKLFESVKMIPIYRKRDGWNNISKNDAVFDQCHSILNEYKCILIFPEGSHSLLRKVRPLTKGFARILFGAFEKYPNLEVQIVPIGLNYNKPINYPSSVTVHYGKPILANPYFNCDDVLTSISSLKDEVQNQMVKLTTHIEGNAKAYSKTADKLTALNVDYLNPDITNDIIKNIDNYTVEPSNLKSKKRKSLGYYIVIINSIFPWLIWNKAKISIKELEFKSTFRFGLGISLFPIFYILQSLLISFLFGKSIGLYYFSFCVLSGLALTKFSKTN